MSSDARLDHIIILVPHAFLADPPSWLTDNFTISPGGQHADGKTENKLICFKDGSYLELIAFINDDENNRGGHWWGTKQFGIIDFALTHPTGDPAMHLSELQQKLATLKSPVEYDMPIAGGRMRPDGLEVKWLVTFPGARFQRGELPFFCHDRTSRSLRVPLSPQNVDHPCAAYGIKSMSVFVLESKLASLEQGYASILNNTSPSNGVFKIQRYNDIAGSEAVELYIREPPEKWRVDEMRGRGGIFIGDMILGCSNDVAPVRLARIDPQYDGLGGIFVSR